MSRRGLGVLLAGLLLSSTGWAEEELWREHPHHVSALVAGTYVGEEEGDDESAFTLGFDYEYRLNQRLGLGVVAERAFDPIEATTVLAVADIHLWQGLCVQVGPGVEVIDAEAPPERPRPDDDELFVLRLGMLYELEFERFTFSPQLHFDKTDEAEAWVLGGAFGFAF